MAAPNTAIWVRRCIFSLASRRETWFLTVFSARNSRAPISRLDSPSAISAKHRAFALGQRLPLRVGPGWALPQAGEHPGGDRRVQQGLALRHPLHRLDQISAADLLEHIPRGTRHDGREQRFIIVVGGQDQARGQRRADLPADLDATAIG
jgi:hypothetical protein